MDPLIHAQNNFSFVMLCYIIWELNLASIEFKAWISNRININLWDEITLQRPSCGVGENCVDAPTVNYGL